METPLFVPFNIRNNIIIDNKLKDINELKSQYDILSSHMSEKQIFDGINDRIGKVFFSKARANFNVSNSPEAFKKGQVMTRFEYLKSMVVN